MKTGFLNRSCIPAALFVGSMLSHAVHAQQIATPAKSEWVTVNPDGKLHYKTLKGGDRIMDFSDAGYMGGGVSIPDPAVKISLSPVPGDNSKAIQDAIDALSKMPLQNGFRGAVLLKPGIYNCEQAIVIQTSGVVLRGSGSTADGTVLNMTGKPHACVLIKGNASTKTMGKPTFLADAYVPSAAITFKLKEVSGLAAGDTVRISKPVTPAWLSFMGMDTLTRNGKPQTWITGEINTDRIIRKIENHTITIDVPLTDNYDARYLGTNGVAVTKISSGGELAQVGIENLRMVSPDQTGTIDEAHHKAFSISGASDAWARNIAVFNTVNSINVTGRRITLDQISIVHNLATTGAAKPADLNGSGQQILFNNCSITGDNVFFFATGAKVTGPIVLLNCVFKGNGWIQPHQRWATGLLIDNCQVPDGGIDFMNRGAMGSGHGWSIGWAVAWNCKARSFLNQQPPGAANWVIGSTGEHQRKPMPFFKGPMVTEGFYDSSDKPVAPASLYLSQLQERLGAAALKNIGY